MRFGAFKKGQSLNIKAHKKFARRIEAKMKALQLEKDHVDALLENMKIDHPKLRLIDLRIINKIVR
jgi:hypothetical protein